MTCNDVCIDSMKFKSYLKSNHHPAARNQRAKIQKKIDICKCICQNSSFFVIFSIKEAQTKKTIRFEINYKLIIEVPELITWVIDFGPFCVMLITGDCSVRSTGTPASISSIVSSSISTSFLI